LNSSFFSEISEKLEGVVAEYGTPVWLYDENTILNRIADLKKFDVIRYAQKANSNLALLSLMRSRGVVVDAVSAGEIERAVRAGFKGGTEHPQIVYTADILDDEALKLVQKHRLPVNIGSPDMLDVLKNAGVETDVIIRINPGFGHGHSQKVNTGGDLSKHGVWHGQLGETISHARELGLKVVGLHMHIGSGSDFDHLSKVCHAMVDAADALGKDLKVISAGGGIPIPYHHDQPERIDLNAYYDLWDNARKTIEQKIGSKVSLEVEPGRYLIAEAGLLITQVRSVKKMADNQFYLIDAGFSDLVRPSFYGSYHEISVLTSATDKVQAVVAGPLCESCDVFTQEEGGFVTTRELPQAKVGDLLVLHDAGAYGAAMSSNYNSRLYAPELLWRDGKAVLIRKRQTFDHLLALEIIPE